MESGSVTITRRSSLSYPSTLPLPQQISVNLSSSRTTDQWRRFHSGVQVARQRSFLTPFQSSFRSQQLPKNRSRFTGFRETVGFGACLTITRKSKTEPRQEINFVVHTRISFPFRIGSVFPRLFRHISAVASLHLSRGSFSIEMIFRDILHQSYDDQRYVFFSREA